MQKCKFSYDNWNDFVNYQPEGFLREGYKRDLSTDHIFKDCQFATKNLYAPNWFHNISEGKISSLSFFCSSITLDPLDISNKKKDIYLMASMANTQKKKFLIH